MWALGNYSRFIRPGMKRIEVENQNPVQAATDVMISAYKDAATKKLVIVAINANENERTYQLDIDGQIKNQSLIPYITSEGSNLEKGKEVAVDNIVIPAKSIVTYIGEVE